MDLLYVCCFPLQVEMDGLTGAIAFDSLGFRSDFVLEIVELKREGLVKVGSWNQGKGVNFTRNYTETSKEIEESLHNKTLKITTILVSVKGHVKSKSFPRSKSNFCHNTHGRWCL